MCSPVGHCPIPRLTPGRLPSVECSARPAAVWVCHPEQSLSVDSHFLAAEKASDGDRNTTWLSVGLSMDDSFPLLHLNTPPTDSIQFHKHLSSIICISNQLPLKQGEGLNAMTPSLSSTGFRAFLQNMLYQFCFIFSSYGRGM